MRQMWLLPRVPRTVAPALVYSFLLLHNKNIPIEIFLGRGTLDLGAEWVHGEDGNAVYKMASQYDLLYRSESPFETSTIYRSDGKPYNRDMAAELLVILDDIVDNRANEIKAYNGSLGDFFVER